MKNPLPLVLVIIALGLSGFFVYVATFRSLTLLEGTLLQIFILVAGLGGSGWFGRQFGVNRSHARSAFRRVLQLYKSISRLSATIQSVPASPSVDDYKLVLARIDTGVTEQIATADDALEDWHDLVPEQVEELRGRGHSIDN
jgi:hypothetical protein